MQSTETISINVKLTILKPVQDIFQATLNPIPFFVERSSGPLREGQTIQWKFPEMSQQISVQVKKVIPNQEIQLDWDSGLGPMNHVEFTFDKRDGKATTLTITESGWPANEKGREASYRNDMGWTHFACSLKAYLEYGVNLRKGSFLHMKF